MVESNAFGFTELEVVAKESDALPVMTDVIRASITSDIHPTRLPGLVKSGGMRLTSVRDNLELLSGNLTTNEKLASAANNLKCLFEDGNCNSLKKFATHLDELERLATASEPFALATVLKCQALVAASMQDYLSAADLCKKSASIQGLAIEQKWHLSHLQTQLLMDYGREFDDDAALQASIDLLKNEILPLAEESESAEFLAASFATLGKVLGMIGQRRKGTRYLEDAVIAFREALRRFNPELTPMQWANTQNGLGNALGWLGQRSADNALLQQSIEAFEQALTKQNEELCAYNWASTMNNMAAVLQSLGRKENNPRILKRSVESYKAVLRVWTRATVPLDWATTMDNLGTALRNLGEHRRGPGTLKQAVAAYQSSLAERIRELVPDEWAMTHNNLGAALHKLAQREENPEILERATEAYEKTLAEWNREKVPMTWAMTMANLGVARRELAEMTGDIQTAKKALEEIQCAVDIFRSASHAQYTELGEEQHLKARLLLDSLAAGNDCNNINSDSSSVDDCSIEGVEKRLAEKLNLDEAGQQNSCPSASGN